VWVSQLPVGGAPLPTGLTRESMDRTG
jgi:hypothetical protein